VRGRGHRARIGFARRAGAGPVRVDVVQQSSGARVLAGRLVARFNRRTRSFTWNGRANRPGRQVTDGFLVVRLRARTPHGVEVRRLALRRVGGRLRARPAFQRRATCSALRSFSLGRPVFGGATGIRLTISYRLAQAARVTIRITHAGRTAKRITRRGSAARIRVRPRGLPAGDYRIRISAAGVRSVLTARRL
jgi:hypothetical protein